MFLQTALASAAAAELTTQSDIVRGVLLKDFRRRGLLRERRSVDPADEPAA
jgi:hypothetical protein